MTLFSFIGVLQGIVGTLGVTTGFISPVIVGMLTYNQVTFLNL